MPASASFHTESAASHRPSGPKDLMARREFRLVLAILAVFLTVTLLDATRSPTVSTDEPGYTDPAANYYFGSGFTSTMWAQDRHDFWCGNVPLYQLILCGWFKCFGFGLFQTRAVNAFLAAGGSFLIWAVVRRTAMIQTAGWRLLALILLLSGSATTLTFRTIRPDATMFFACATVFFFSCWPRRLPVRCLLGALAATLLPVAGVPMIPYTALFLSIWLICFGLSRLILPVSIGLGVGAGVGLLVLFYQHFASFKVFLGIILPFTVLGSGTANPGHSMLFQKLFGTALDPDNVFTSFFGDPREALNQKTLFDWSAALLFCLFVMLAARSAKWSDRGFRRKVLFVTLLTLVVPPVMHIVGHYRSYYRWMTYMPLTIGVAWLLESEWPPNGAVNFRRLAWLLLGASVFLGLPFRTLVTLPEWTDRSTAPLDRTMAALAQPDDVVVCARKVWFSVRPRVRLVYACDLPARGDFSLTVNLPTNEVSLLCLFPEDHDPVMEKIGGQWSKLSDREIPGVEALRETRYAVDFYRRRH